MLAVVGSGRDGGLVRIKPVHGVALQESDLDGLLVVAMHHAAAFTEDIDGADAGTTQAQNVCIENGVGGAAQIAARDFLDEFRDVDMRRAGLGTGSVVAKEAARGLDYGGLRSEGGMQVGE